MAGLDQIAGIHFLHPSIGFLALALVMAFLSNERYMTWRWLLLAPLVLAIFSVMSLTFVVISSVSRTAFLMLCGVMPCSSLNAF